MMHSPIAIQGARWWGMPRLDGRVGGTELGAVAVATAVRGIAVVPAQRGRVGGVARR